MAGKYLIADNGGAIYSVSANESYYQIAEADAPVGLPESLDGKFLFLGHYSNISGGEMPNILGADSLTVSGDVGSETYQCPNTQEYINADTDGIWFIYEEPQNTTTANLIGYDFGRTIVKYNNDSPSSIETIGILKADETLTSDEENELHSFFNLPVYWSGAFNEYGRIKSNRGLEKSVYLGTAPHNLSVSLEGSDIIRLTWDCNASDEDGFKIYASVEGADYSLLDIVAADVGAYDDVRADPVFAISYKVAAYKGAEESAYSNIVTTSTVGDSLVDEGAESFESENSVWKAIGSNTLNVVSGELIMTYIDNELGFYIDLRESGGLTEDLVVDDVYRMRTRIKVNSGASLNLYSLSGLGGDITNESYADHYLTHTASSPTTNDLLIINFNAGDVATMLNWDFRKYING
jgi:hypothetical protein